MADNGEPTKQKLENEMDVVNADIGSRPERPTMAEEPKEKVDEKKVGNGSVSEDTTDTASFRPSAAPFHPDSNRTPKTPVTSTTSHSQAHVIHENIGGNPSVPPRSGYNEANYSYFIQPQSIHQYQSSLQPQAPMQFVPNIARPPLYWKVKRAFCPLCDEMKNVYVCSSTPNTHYPNPNNYPGYPTGNVVAPDTLTLCHNLDYINGNIPPFQFVGENHSNIYQAPLQFVDPTGRIDPNYQNGIYPTYNYLNPNQHMVETVTYPTTIYGDQRPLSHLDPNGIVSDNQNQTVPEASATGSEQETVTRPAIILKSPKVLIHDKGVQVPDKHIKKRKKKSFQQAHNLIPMHLPPGVPIPSDPAAPISAPAVRISDPGIPGSSSSATSSSSENEKANHLENRENLDQFKICEACCGSGKALKIIKHETKVENIFTISVDGGELVRKWGYFFCRSCLHGWMSQRVWCLKDTDEVYVKQTCNLCKAIVSPEFLNDYRQVLFDQSWKLCDDPPLYIQKSFFK